MGPLLLAFDFTYSDLEAAEELAKCICRAGDMP